MKTENMVVQFLALILYISLCEAGISYIRWGRTTCPTGALLLYKGYMVGNHYAKPGSGANFLCTTETPEFGNSPGSSNPGGLWGIEYEASVVFSTENVASGILRDQDAVCARCYVADSSDVFMIPGAHSCQDTGYALQYKGYIVSQSDYEGRARSEYVCLDEAPEGRSGGSTNNDQGLIYQTVLYCGSIPCGPYKQGMAATCAVCAY